MRELELIGRIAAAAGVSRNPEIIKGIGDDCAVVRPPRDADLVFTTDFVLQNRHFRLEKHTAAQIGRKALARSLSDLAAMGAKPLFCLVSLAMPDELTGSWTDEFYSGLLGLAAEYEISLAGGDLSNFDTVCIDVMCCGETPVNSAILRSGAKPGDRIYVTGPLGAAIYSNWTAEPKPRIREGMALRNRVSAGMDISDGLSIDLHRLCVASGVGAQLRSDQIPVAAGASLEEALHGGEDYELLVTSREQLQFVEIGSIVSDPAGRVLLDGEPLPVAGYQHFNTGASL